MDNPSSQFVAHLDACPKCGYKPVSPDDPLRTAHNGEGECPSCGIIPVKYDRVRTNYTERAGGMQSPKLETDPPEYKPQQPHLSSFFVKTLVVGLLLVGVIGYYYLRHDETKVPEEGPLMGQKPDSSGRGAGSDSIPASVLAVAPGEEKTFTTSGYLPFFHSDEEDPVELESRWIVGRNKWDELGVSISPGESTITAESVVLWTYRSEGEEIWQPLWADSWMHFNRKFTIFRYGRALQADFRFPNIIWCTDIWALRKFAEAPKSKAEQILKEMVGGSPELRQNKYYFYRANLKFSVSVAHGNKFSSESPLRKDTFGLSLTGVNAGDAVLNLDTGAVFEMAHELNTEGIVLKQASAWILEQSK